MRPEPETPAPFVHLGKPPGQIQTALTIFRVTAMIVGVGLLVLVVEMILRYGFDNHALDWWPQPHGFIFLGYVAAVANLGFKVGWGLPKMVLVMLAGCVPLLSFVVERRMSREVEGYLAMRPVADGAGAGQ